MDWGAIGTAITGSGGLVSAYANWRQAALDRDFQRGMANTAHQREVQDLMAAGLNPILSATGGAGAATPGGGRMSISDPSSSAFAAIRNKLELDLLRMQIQKTYWDAESASTDVSLKLDQKPGVQATSSILSNSAKGMALEGEIDTTKYGEVMRYIDRAVRAVTGGSSAASRVLK